VARRPFIVLDELGLIDESAVVLAEVALVLVEFFVVVESLGVLVLGEVLGVALGVVLDVAHVLVLTDVLLHHLLP
jgi:hypothetical protein